MVLERVSSESQMQETLAELGMVATEFEETVTGLELESMRPSYCVNAVGPRPLHSNDTPIENNISSHITVTSAWTLYLNPAHFFLAWPSIVIDNV